MWKPMLQAVYHLPRYTSCGARGRAARRVDQLSAELGFDRQRLVGWGLAQAVLSAWWSYEDHGRGWEGGLACAEILQALE